MWQVIAPDRIEVLRRRLRDAESIMGCGDNPDIGQATAEIERIEAEIGVLMSVEAEHGRSKLHT